MGNTINLSKIRLLCTKIKDVDLDQNGDLQSLQPLVIRSAFK